MDDRDFAWLRGFLRERAGLLLDDDKAYLAKFRLEPLAQREGFSSLSSMIAQLSAAPSNGLHARTLEAMTINETSFFRDAHPFEALRTRILPELLELRREERRLVLWSAACASGQEPYSLAMLLSDQFAGVLAGWEVRLVGSDLASATIDRARAGLYSQLEVNRGLPASCLLNHFEKEGLDWRIRPEIRKRVELQVLNLLDDWAGLPAPDVILLRNALIYMAEDVRRSILARIRRFLRPGGVLLLGAAETILGQEAEFERVQFGTCCAYRAVPPGENAR